MLTMQQARDTLHEMLCSQTNQERADALRMAVGLMDGELRSSPPMIRSDAFLEPMGDPRPRYSVTLPAWPNVVAETVQQPESVESPVS